MTPQPDLLKKMRPSFGGERTAAASLVSGEGRQPGRKTLCSYLSIEKFLLDIVVAISGAFAVDGHRADPLVHVATCLPGSHARPKNTR
jgi:hypothetical protein